MKTYWETLQIKPTNNIKEIKKAYAKLLKIYHPEDNLEKFKEIRMAYEQAIIYAKLDFDREDDVNNQEVSDLDHNQDDDVFYHQIERYMQEIADSTKMLIDSSERDNVLRWKELFSKYYGNEELIFETMFDYHFDSIQNDVVYYYLEDYFKTLPHQNDKYKKIIADHLVQTVNQHIQKDVGLLNMGLADISRLTIMLTTFLNFFVLLVLFYRSFFVHTNAMIHISYFYVILLNFYQSVKVLIRLEDRTKFYFSRSCVMIFIVILLAISSMICCYLGYNNIFHYDYQLKLLWIVCIINFIVFIIRKTNVYQQVAIEKYNKEHVIYMLSIPGILFIIFLVIMFIVYFIKLKLMNQGSLPFLAYIFYIFCVEMGIINMAYHFDDSCLEKNHFVQYCGVCHLLMITFVTNICFHYLFTEVQLNDSMTLINISIVLTLVCILLMTIDRFMHRKIYKKIESNK